MSSSSTTDAARSSDELAFALIATLRAHGHLCNVLTHIGSDNWRAIERAIASILYPRIRATALNAIGRNILELVSDQRGVTGPIMRSVFFEVIAGEVGAAETARLKRKIARLRDRLRAEVPHRAAPSPQRPLLDDAGAAEPRPDAPARQREPLSKAA